jgi:hypothetical protein
VGNRRVFLDSSYHTYTAEGFAPCASSLLVGDLYNTPHFLLVTNVPPFTSRHSNVNALVYFLCFTIYLISRFKMPLPSIPRAPTIACMPSSARVGVAVT